MSFGILPVARAMTVPLFPNLPEQRPGYVEADGWYLGKCAECEGTGDAQYTGDPRDFIPCWACKGGGEVMLRVPTVAVTP